MNIHKNTRLTPHDRQAIWRAYTQDKITVTSLARQYKVSRVTIYRIKGNAHHPFGMACHANNIGQLLPVLPVHKPTAKQNGLSVH